MPITSKKTARQERRVATELGGRRVPLSGAGAEKGDGRVAQQYTKTAEGIQETVGLTFRIENKMTGRDSYTLSSSDWDKLHRSATACGEHPLFHIELTVAGLGRAEIVVLTESLFGFLGFEVKNRWGKDRSARSFGVSWARCQGESMPFGLHMHGGHELVVANYYLVRNRIQEIQCEERDQHLRRS
jgi:hypothetical protein